MNRDGRDQDGVGSLAAERSDGEDVESVSVQSVVAIDTADTAPALGTSAGLLGQPDRRRAAEKLRDKGWSYRRIAENLNVPYILVSKWLSEEPAVPPPPVGAVPAVVPRHRRRPTVADLDDAADTIETLKLQYAALDGYVRPMLAELERARTDGAEAAREREQFNSRIAALEVQLLSLKAEVRTLAQRPAAAAVALESVAEAAEEDTADPFAEAAADPFAEAAADPFAEAAADPFAEAAADPFAEAAVDPFAEAAADPFAEAAADPFAEAAADPFAEAAADPFAEAAVDPFAEVAADPFAEAAADPFAEAAVDPFAEAAADPVAEAAADPFAEAAADPFAETEAAEPAAADPPAKSLGKRLKFWKS